MMRTKWLAVFVTTLVLLALAMSATANASDPQSGTWKINAAKSKYSPGPAPKSLSVKIEADENGIKINAEGTNSDGTPIHVEYSAKFDGKDYPTTGNPNGDTVSVKRIDASTLESTTKKGGQATVTITSTVSKDGKTRTSVWKGKDAQGREVNNTVVFDKQ